MNAKKIDKLTRELNAALSSPAAVAALAKVMKKTKSNWKPPVSVEKPSSPKLPKTVKPMPNQTSLFDLSGKDTQR